LHDDRNKDDQGINSYGGTDQASPYLTPGHTVGAAEEPDGKIVMQVLLYLKLTMRLLS
jgi:hypothetical protein